MRKKREGKEKVEKTFSKAKRREKPERSESSGEQKALTRSKPSGSKRRVRLTWGEKATEAPWRGREVFPRSARVESEV